MPMVERQEGKDCEVLFSVQVQCGRRGRRSDAKQLLWRGLLTLEGRPSVLVDTWEHWLRLYSPLESTFGAWLTA